MVCIVLVLVCAHVCLLKYTDSVCMFIYRQQESHRPLSRVPLMHIKSKHFGMFIQYKCKINFWTQRRPTHNPTQHPQKFGKENPVCAEESEASSIDDDQSIRVGTLYVCIGCRLVWTKWQFFSPGIFFFIVESICLIGPLTVRRMSCGSVLCELFEESTNTRVCSLNYSSIYWF